MKLRAFVDQAVLIGFCAEFFRKRLQFFVLVFQLHPYATFARSLLEKTSIFYAYYSGYTLGRLLHGEWFCALIVLVRLHP
jgi:hypothetical protein